MSTLTRSTTTTPQIDLRVDARWIALGLFLLTILTRLPFQSQYLYHWDSVNMAFGIRQFDVMNGAPQFPGYIVYIALAQFVNLFTGDEQTTMLLISIVSSALAVTTIFYLGRDMFNAAVGLIAAVFTLTSPLVWFYSEIALPHAMDLFAVTLSVWLLYRIMTGEHRGLWLSAVFLALVGGFRQQNLLFLGPLILFALYPLGVVRIILFAAVGFVTTLFWFIPLMIFSGGFGPYMAGSSSFSAAFWDTTSLLHGAGLVGLRRDLIKLIPYTLFAWSLAIVPALIYWPLQFPKAWRGWLTSRKAWFMLLWVGPTLAFYIIIHMGQQGLVFVFLPALILMSAAGLYRLLADRPQLLAISTAIIGLVGAGIFIIAPTYPLGESGPKLLTYSTLREQDTLLANQIATVRANFSAEDTLLVAGSWRFVEYYLPEYTFARFNIGARWEVSEGQATGADHEGVPMSAATLGLEPANGWNIVLIDDALREFTDASVETAAGPGGFTLDYLPLTAEQAYLVEDGVIGITAAE